MANRGKSEERETGSRRTGRKEAALPSRVRKALAYIDGKYRQNIRLEEVADAVGMNKCSFCRVFRQATGTTFTYHLNHLRLEEVQKLLLTSNTYIFQVAHRAGFKSLSYFRSKFKKQYGCSPREYRNGFGTLPR